MLCIVLCTGVRRVHMYVRALVHVSACVHMHVHGTDVVCVWVCVHALGCTHVSEHCVLCTAGYTCVHACVHRLHVCCMCACVHVTPYPAVAACMGWGRTRIRDNPRWVFSDHACMGGLGSLSFVSLIPSSVLQVTPGGQGVSLSRCSTEGGAANRGRGP